MRTTTKHQQKLRRKLKKQEKLAAENKLKKSPGQIKRNTKRRQREQQKKAVRKAAKRMAENIQPSRPFNVQEHHPIIFIGQSKIQPCIKRYPRPPLLPVERKLLLLENVVVIRVDEFRTTQNCSLCLKQAIVSTHGHRWIYCPTCGITQNRDVNASRNICRLGLVCWYLLNRNVRPNEYSSFLPCYLN